MSSIKTWISHNQGMFVALLLVSSLLIWTFGCESKVSSISSAGKQVTRDELNLEVQQASARLDAELDILLKQAELKQQQLDRQDELKRKIFEFAAMTAQSGTFNPAGLITLAGSILGLGAVVDNRIKDKVIANRPNPAKTKTSVSS